LEQKQADRLAFRQKIAILIGGGLIIMMGYYAFLVPEVAECNAYYEEEFETYKNYTEENCILWKADVYGDNDYRVMPELEMRE